MKCQKCQSERLAQIIAHCSDRFTVELLSFNHEEEPDYVPTDLNLGSNSDQVKFTYCLDCGQMQGKWPLPSSQIENYLNELNNELDPEIENV